jgi:AAA ATPase-like protein
VEQAIIGRERELAATGRLLDRAAEGAAVLVVDGEAGIGKTTLWLEAVRAADARGFRVLEARPAESEAKFSYSAVADLVGAAFEDTESVLPPLQRRALEAALLLGDTDEPAGARTTSAALVAVLHALTSRVPYCWRSTTSSGWTRRRSRRSRLRRGGCRTGSRYSWRVGSRETPTCRSGSRVRCRMTVVSGSSSDRSRWRRCTT